MTTCDKSHMVKINSIYAATQKYIIFCTISAFLAHYAQLCTPFLGIEIDLVFEIQFSVSSRFSILQKCLFGRFRSLKKMLVRAVPVPRP